MILSIIVCVPFFLCSALVANDVLATLNIVIWLIIMKYF